jgi:glutamate transport system substrate-binding protein
MAKSRIALWSALSGLGVGGVVVGALIATGALSLGGSATPGPSDDGLSPGTGGPTAPGPSATATLADTEGEYGLDPNVIRIGVKAWDPGLGYLYDGVFTGFDIDLATHLAADLGYTPDQIEWVEAHPLMRESLLTLAEVDIVVATYSITPDRKEVVDFVGPYFVAAQDLLVRADDESIQTIDDIAGRTICAPAGTTVAELIRTKYPDIVVDERATYTACIDALIAGEIDAVTAGDVILAGLAHQPIYEGQVHILGANLQQEFLGIGIPNGSPLCEPLTESLTRWIDDGGWLAAFDSNLRVSGFTPEKEGNPPTPEPCP